MSQTTTKTDRIVPPEESAVNQLLEIVSEYDVTDVLHAIWRHVIELETPHASEDEKFKALNNLANAAWYLSGPDVL